MECPYCKRKFDVSETNMNKIIRTLKIDNSNIKNLVIKTGIKRSTLVYYLGKLESKGMIIKERMETKFSGRPTLYSLIK